MIEKYARKPSLDPIQEKLRSSKGQWNKEVSEFINDLINLKKTMNGWPSKFHMEKSSIKDPIPADPVTIIGALAGDFQDLSQKGKSIIQQQLDYAKNRKKPGVKPVAPTTDLSKQLSLPLGKGASMISNASDPFSRFWSSVKGPWFGTSNESRERKYRLSILKAVSDLNKKMNKFEADIVGSSLESIFKASKLFSKIITDTSFIQNSFETYRSTLSQDLPPATPINYNVLSEAKNAADDFRKNYLNFNNLNPEIVKNLTEKISSFLSSSNDEDKNKFAVEVIKLYQDLLDDTNSKNGTSSNNLSDILLNKKASLEVFAQALITKWLGKLKHKLSPFDKTSALRLDIFNISEEVRQTLDKIMNELEKSINTELIDSYLKIVVTKINNISVLMKPLESIVENNLYDKTFIDMLSNKKITDLNIDLTVDQRKRLERMLENKQFRNISKLYSNKK